MLSNNELGNAFVNFRKKCEDLECFNKLSEQLSALVNKIKNANPNPNQSQLEQEIFFALIDKLNTKIFVDNTNIKERMIQKLRLSLGLNINNVSSDNIRVMLVPSLEEDSDKHKGFTLLLRLLEQADDLRPMIEAHEQFKKDVAELESYSVQIAKTSPEHAKEQTSNCLAQQTKKHVQEYVKDVCWNYQDTTQQDRLKILSTHTQAALNSTAGTAKETLEQHRRPMRLWEKIILSAGFVVTIGMGFIGKLIYSKVRTGEASVFDGRTRSAGKAVAAVEKANNVTSIIPVSPKAVVKKLVELENNFNHRVQVAQFFNISEDEVSRLEYRFKEDISEKIVEGKISDNALEALANELSAGLPLGTSGLTVAQIKRDWPVQVGQYLEEQLEALVF